MGRIEYGISNYQKYITLGEDAYCAMMPLHLFKFIESNGYYYDNSPNGYDINPNMEYELYLEATIQDVYNFYHDSGYYEVGMKDNQVILQQALLESSSCENDEIYKLPAPFIIDVIERGGKVYFTYQIEGIADEKTAADM